MTMQTHTVGVPEWELSDRLGKALKASGVSVQDMAAELGCNRNTVGNYLSGRITPRVPVLRVWALRTGVPFEWIAHGIEPNNGPDNTPGQVIDGIGWFGRIAAPRPELHLAETG